MYAFGKPNGIYLMSYWHPWALRRPMREIASRYPTTYKKVGKTIESLGYDLTVEPKAEVTYRMMIAILAAMPPHVVPYGSMGDNKSWGEINWQPFLDELYTETWLPDALARDAAWRAKRGIK